MKATELRNLSKEELHKEYENSLQELFNLNMQRGMKQTIKPHLIKAMRKKVARILTIMNMHEKRVK